MSNGNEDREILLYKKLMEEELSRPEIEQEKNLFIQKHFPSDVPVFGGFQMLVPALCILAVFLVSTQLWNSRYQLEAPQAPAVHEAPVMTEAAPQAKPAAAVPVTEVKRVSSEVGPTLVYQKMIQDKPITIVWVFPGMT